MKTQCPKCGALEGVSVLYGRPSAEAMEQAAKGELRLRGCLSSANLDRRERECLACGTTWLHGVPGSARTVQQRQEPIAAIEAKALARLKRIEGD
jgi:hypothetical protein